MALLLAATQPEAGLVFLACALILALFGALGASGMRWIQAGHFRRGRGAHAGLDGFAGRFRDMGAARSRHDWSGRTSDGRDASVRIGIRQLRADGPGARVHCARFAVRADKAPRLMITRETDRTRRRRASGLFHDFEIGDARFDGKYLMATRDPERAREVLSAPLKKAIDHLFGRYRIERLQLGQGRLVALARAGKIDADDFRSVLELLAEAAATFDRVELKVRALDAERQAARGPGGAPRCAYCHGDVTGTEPDLVACERCGTVLHEGCWEECDRCPILGCAGEHAERSRARDR